MGLTRIAHPRPGDVKTVIGAPKRVPLAPPAAASDDAERCAGTEKPASQIARRWPPLTFMTLTPFVVSSVRRRRETISEVPRDRERAQARPPARKADAGRG